MYKRNTQGIIMIELSKSRDSTQIDSLYPQPGLQKTEIKEIKEYRDRAIKISK